MYKIRQRRCRCEKERRCIMETKAAVKAEESLIFMMLMTFIGGFINAYSFLTRGGAFVSMHTGNMARLGITLFQGNFSGALGCIIPIVGTVLGGIIAQYLKMVYSKKSLLYWQKFSLAAELVMLLAIGFVPMEISNGIVNWILSVVTGFQLSNFRQYEGAVHNTTICTGNLRTVGQYLCDALMKRSKAAFLKCLRYILLVFSFPLGAGIGVAVSVMPGSYAVWICCVALFIMIAIISNKLPIRE